MTRKIIQEASKAGFIKDTKKKQTTKIRLSLNSKNNIKNIFKCCGFNINYREAPKINTRELFSVAHLMVAIIIL